MMNTDDCQACVALNVTVLEQSPELVRIQAPVEGNRQPFGILHGGVNAFLVEEAGSHLALKNSPEGRVPVGTELNLSNIQSVSDGHVIASATVLNKGKSSIVTNVDIHNDVGELTATGRLTCVYIRTHI